MARTRRKEVFSAYRFFTSGARRATRERVHKMNKGIRTRSKHEASTFLEVTDSQKRGKSTSEWLL